MKILVHAPIPSDGTSFYRAHGPFNHLQKRYPDIQIVNGSVGGFEFNWYTLLDVDIVFVQRPSTAEHLEIINIAKRCKKSVWIDFDDDYINIPESNPRFELYSTTSRQAQIRECMREADVITVSTQALKQSIEKEVALKREVVVIENAYDPNLFTLANETEPEKVVFWRGGDTHVKDVELYKEAILHCFDKHTEYKWVFFGHKFPWLTEHAISNNQQSRVVTYAFNDIMQYYNALMQIRPEIMIVPLEDNAFNRAKSNIAWIEGTLAGAVVMATELPEFQKTGCATFSTKQDFIDTFDYLSKNRSASYFHSKNSIPSLSEKNTLRYQIANSLLDNKKFTPVEVMSSQWNDKRFFEYGMIYGHNQENPGYAKGHHSVADWLIETLKPTSMIEFGCGPGAMLERFLVNNVESIGLEINPYSIDYFKTRNPVFADRILDINFAVENLDDLQIEETDLGISIEVFEHIVMPEEWWNKFINKLSTKIKHFYFSGTPDQSTVEFDQQWGHYNVRQKEAWIDLFERNGWKYTGNPMKICSWDMLFTSVNIAKG